MLRPIVLLGLGVAGVVLLLVLCQNAAAQDPDAHRRSMGNLDPNPDRRSMGNLRPQPQPTPQGSGQSSGTTTYVIPNPYYPGWRYIPQPVYPAYPYGYGYSPGYYYPPSYYPPSYYPYGYYPRYGIPRYPRRF